MATAGRPRPLGTAPLLGQRGVIAAAGGDVLAVDLFDRRATLADYWPALVSGYLLDALAVRSRRPHPSPAGLDGLLTLLVCALWHRVPGRGLGEELHLDAPGLAATGLAWQGALVHVAAFPTGTGRAAPRRWFHVHDA